MTAKELHARLWSNYQDFLGEGKSLDNISTIGSMPKTLAELTQPLKFKRQVKHIRSPLGYRTEEYELPKGRTVRINQASKTELGITDDLLSDRAKVMLGMDTEALTNCRIATE